jgi:hypothetical protein
VQNVFLDRPSEDGMLSAFAHMSITCDPRAPTDLPSDFPLDPKIKTLEKRMGDMKKLIKTKYDTIRNAGSTEVGKEYQSLTASLNAA